MRPVRISNSNFSRQNYLNWWTASHVTNERGNVADAADFFHETTRRGGGRNLRCFEVQGAAVVNEVDDLGQVATSWQILERTDRVKVLELCKFDAADAHFHSFNQMNRNVIKFH
jgi:hypothetical protein